MVTCCFFGNFFLMRQNSSLILIVCWTNQFLCTVESKCFKRFAKRLDRQPIIIVGEQVQFHIHSFKPQPKTSQQKNWRKLNESKQARKKERNNPPTITSFIAHSVVTPWEESFGTWIAKMMKTYPYIFSLDESRTCWFPLMEKFIFSLHLWNGGEQNGLWELWAYEAM